MSADDVIAETVRRLRQIDGVAAIVLGGSRARRTHAPTSDVDIGLYYHPDRPPDLAALERLAAQIDDDRRPGLVTPIGGWGPWINGGGWLVVGGVPVDFLYRDLARVAAVVDDCHGGRVEIAYQPGHPHGFVSAIYMAELALCRPLWDPAGVVARLKSRTSPYPAALRHALIERFGWEIGFSLDVARKGVGRADASYVAGCCFRAIACLMQTLFALNRHYCMNEKGAVALANTFTHVPAQLQVRVEAAITHLAPEQVELTAAIDLLQDLLAETDALLAESAGVV